MGHSLIPRLLLIALLIHIISPQFCDASCLTCANSTSYGCLSCDQDLTLDNIANACVGMSTANSQAYNTQVLQTIDGSFAMAVPGYVTEINDANGNSYTDVAAYIAVNGSGSNILLSSSSSGSFNRFRVVMGSTPPLIPSSVYKYAIKITGLFSGTCTANEINLLSVTAADTNTFQQTIPIQFISDTFFRVTTNYFAADKLGSLTVTLAFLGSNGACGPLTIGSIAIIGFLCDVTCTTCTMSTPCSCTSGTYLTTLNTCAYCSLGCNTCAKVGSSVICSACTAPYLLIGSACINTACGNGFYPAVVAAQPACLACASICETCTNPSTCVTCKTGYLFYGGTGCGTSCPFGQYQNAGACQLCNSNCASCVTSPTNCLSCGLLGGNQAYLDIDNTCVAGCSTGTFARGFQCFACPAQCQACSYSGSVQCSICKPVSMTNYYLSGTSCVSTCPDGKYPGTSGGNPTCVTCDSPCGTCNAAGSTSCLSCATGRLIYGTTTCGVCTPGQYANSASTCALCDSNCATCSGTSTHCLSCGIIVADQSYLYSDFKCYTTCPSGSYAQLTGGSNYVCSTCPTGCAACALVGGSVQCSLCTSVLGTQYYRSGTSCTTNCGAGNFGGADGSFNPVCSVCVAPCANCLSAVACTSCATGVLVFGTTVCSSTCPFGFYANTSSTCAACAPNCASCSALSTCTSCGLIGGLQSYLSSDNTCYTSCPSGRYAMTTNGAFLCAACPTGCALCMLSGTVQCSECMTVAMTNFFLSGTSCEVTCPDGTYKGATAGKPTCNACTAPCATCSAAGTSACNSCATGRLIYGTNTCGTCTTGQYADSSTTCALCNSNCQTCTGSTTNCQSCGIIAALQSYLYSDAKCYTTCPAGSYADGTGGIYLCKTCPTGCATCSLVGGSVQCTLCTAVAGTPYYISGTSCTSNCGNGKYGGVDGSGNPACLNCVAPCANCLSASSCLTCATGYLISGTAICTTLCPYGSFLNTNTSLCEVCSPSCASCSAFSTCTSCGLITGIQSYLNSNSVCYTTCPTGYATTTANGAHLCLSCPTGCSSCSLVIGTVTCTLCQPVSTINFYLSGGTCVVSCPAGTYAGANGGGDPVCVGCDGSCATCSGTGPSACTRCTGSLLVYGSNTCEASCGNGQYTVTATTCALCDSNCATCSGTSTHCLSCGTIAATQAYLYSDFKCYTTCPSGSYAQLTGGSNYVCSTCPTGCAACALVGGSVQCSLCTSVLGTQYYRSGTSCTTNCGAGNFGGADGSFNPVCSVCVAPCANCLSAVACTSCATGVLVFGTTVCSSTCPFGFYANTSSTCAACAPNCASCSALSTCTSCGLIGGLQSYLSSDNTCYTSCPSGRYAMTTNGAFLCAACPTGCALCVLSGTVQCSECMTVAMTNFFLSGTSCEVTCPDGTYKGATAGKPTCNACTAPCATCSAAGTSACNSCATGRLIYGTNTCGTCTTGQYADSSTTCALCNSNCQTCTGSTTNCQSCGIIAALQSYLYSDAKCYTTCPAGSYADGTGGIYLCKTCPTGCATCSLVGGSVQCTLCTAVAGTPYYISGTSCTSNCGNGKYGGVDGSGNPACLNCVAPCANCLSASSCLTCATGYLISGTAICTTLCPYGSFLNTNTSLCEVCSPSCASCSAFSTCTSCGLITGIQSYLNSNSVCYTTCPTGYATTTANGAHLCLSCPTGCSSCSLVIGTVTCTLCQPVSTINFYLSGGTCVVSCPAGTYAGANGGGDPVCVGCDGSCATCSGTGPSACTRCTGSLLVYGSNTCEASCGNGQYTVTATTCALCDSNCATCSGTSTHCLSCGTIAATQAYLYSDFKCYTTCPSGSYAQLTGGSNYVCSTCPTGCAACALVGGSVQCSLCTSVLGTQYYRSGTSCTTNCGAGNFGGADGSFNPVCSVCVAPCANCLSAVACTSCATGVLVFGTTVCSSTCPFGFYANTSSTCAACAPNCASCSALSTCTSCGLIGGLQSYLSSDNTCYTSCPSGRYAMTTNGAFLCAACPTGCALCVLSGTVQCSECMTVAMTNFFLSGTSCEVTCPDGTYKGATAGKPTCNACTAPCATCSAAGTSACNSCATGRLIYGTNTCGTCTTGQYENSLTTCAPCDSNCQTCTSSATNCQSCGLIATVQSYLHSDAKCYTTCPAGNYADSTGGIYLCKTCPTGCSHCSLVGGSVQCTICKKVSATQYYLSGTGCVSSCGSGNYGGSDGSGNPTCYPCVAPCLNCISSSSCTSCLTGLLVLGGSTCPSDCPTGQYADSGSTCALCNSNCATCTSSSTNCLSCGIQSGAQSYLYSDSKCYINCPSQTFKYSLANSCVDCDASCNGCFDSAVSCIACASSYFRVIGSTACTQNCGTGFYGDTRTKACTACPIGCSTCSMDNSTVLTCSVCNSFAGVQYYLSNSSCLSLCASGTFQGLDGSTNNHTCLSCTSPCKTCASSATYCTSCLTNRLIVGQNTCGTCPSGQFDSSSQTCALCSANCLTCSVAYNNCTSCGFSPLGFHLFLHTDNICYQACPSDFYGDTGSATCQGCHASCQGCVNSNTNCIVCATDYFRVIGSNACTQNCGTKLYGDKTTWLCTACPIGCSTCTQNTTTVICSECQSVAGVQYYLSSTKCLQICPSNTFGGLDGSSKYTCQSCDLSCLTCRGNTTSDCLSCTGSTYLSNGAYTCVGTCPAGQFQTGNICALCNINCLTCGTSSTNCLTCGTPPSGVPLYIYNAACVASCPATFFANSTGNTCDPCDVSCRTCSGPAATQCLSCSTGSLITSNFTCPTNCPDGSYSLNKICYSCLSSCATCSNISHCTSCQSVAGQNYYLDANNKCVINCPSGTYADANTATCIGCTSPCVNCIGSNLCTNCLSSSATPYLNYGDNSCSASCPAGQFAKASTYVCILCSSNCLTCSGASTTCDSCGLSLSSGLQMYLSNTTCLANCPSNTFGAAGNVCSSCDGSCVGCTYSSTNCIACHSSYYRQAGSTLCVNPCPSGFYGDPNTNLCTLCPSGCAVCSYGSGLLPCTSCKVSSGVFYYLDSTTNNCVPQCPSTYFANSTDLTCRVCTGNCATCVDASNCLTCVASSYLGVGTTTCHSSACPAGQYNPTGSLKCQACNMFCFTCSATSTTCNSCTQVGGVSYFLTGNTCTPTCPFGTYGRVSDYTCQPCATGCQSCFGPTTNDCYKCGAFNASVDYSLVHGTNTCQVGCPAGQYVSGYLCLLCSSNCLTCISSSTNCLTCGFSAVGSALYFYSNQCLLTCPNGFWGNPTGYNCDACAIGCATCFGAGLSSCTVCSNDSATIYYKDLKTTTCGTTCPAGQFVSAAVPNLCQACSLVCVTCFGSAENCTSTTCAKNYFFLNNECLLACPNGYHADSTLRQCLACATGCASCFAAGTSSCTACSNSSYLQIGLTSCLAGCNSGEFPSSLNNRCVACNAACATCTALSTCQSCQSVNGIAYFLSGSSCTVACPSNQFGQLSNYQCTACADGCLTCFGPALSDCYTCTASSAPTNHFLVYGTTLCSPTCLPGQYANATSYRCLLCSSTCTTCVTNSLNCLTCGPSPFGYNLYFSTNQCLQTCPNGFWGNVTGYNCDACAIGCATCFGAGLSSCTVCANDTSTIYYKDLKTTTCGTTCPAGQFVSAAVPNLCQACSLVCVTCFGSAENCTSTTCAKNYFFLNNECLLACPNGYHADSTLRQCLACATGCASCFAAGTSSCTACSNSSYLQIGLTSCLAGCNSGEFPSSLNNRCVACNAACATCTALSTCQSCQSVNGIAYFLSNSSCTAACPSNQFGQLSNYQCTACADGCLTCFGPALSDCYTCTASSAPTNHFLVYGTTLCSPTCLPGQYANATSYRCLLCSSNCLTCVTTSTTCTSCGYSVQGFLLYLQNTTCLFDCSVGLYQESLTASCQPCHVACTSCTSNSLSACLGCQTAMIIGVSTKFYKYIGDTICGTGCPLGQFIDDTNSPNKCVICDSNCVGCFGSATNCTIDTGCKVNHYYNNATNSCVLICPDGTFPNVVTKFCEFCTPGCALCYGSGLSKCTKCKIDSTTNYYLMMNLNQCSTSCNSGEYGDPSFNMCFKCNSACATCTSLSTCTSCQSVNGVAYFLNSTLCTVLCPSNQYGNVSSFQCLNCAAECATCFGGANTQCYTCKTVTGTNYYLVFGTYTCSNSCPNGQYSNATDLTCRPCNSQCLTCTNSSSICLTCGFSSNGYNLYYYSNGCLANCPNGFWGNPTGYNCDACAIGCATCFGAGLSSCTVCSNDSATIYYKDLKTTTCGTTCPAGQFVSAAVPNLCQACSLVCVTCFGSAENCTSTTCAKNYFFLNNECLLACPNGYHADSTLRQCLACATGCASCFAAGTSSCTACSNSSYLQIGLTSCLAGCNSGEFPSSLNNRCVACNAACATCTALSTCQSCQSVNGIAYFLSNSSCTVACPSNQFGQLSNYQCTACADGCLTCFGPALSDCYTCTASSAPTNHFLVYGTTLCSPTCLPGQYANATSYRCLLCSSNCLTCVTNSTNCLTCGFSTIGANLYLFGSSCLLTCPNGYFANSLTSTCDLCHFGCSTCIGPLLTNCTVCSDYNNSGTIVSYYKVLEATICSTSCPLNQFINSQVPNSCALCDAGCISCSITSTNCTVSQCSSGYYYLNSNSSCVKTCPNNFYPNNLAICTKCVDGCQLCYGGSLTTCTQCQITPANVSYFKVIDINTCTTVCPPGQYPYQLLLTCRYCSSPCLTCNTSDTDCQTCTNVSGIPYFNLNNKCLVNCPGGYYGQVSNNTCVLCIAGCALCTGGSLTQCSKCKTEGATPYFLVSGTTICSTSCPAGQYSDVAANSCFICDANCLTCVGTSTNCTSCWLTTTGIRLFLESSICVQSCSISMFKQSSNNTCMPCDSGCLVCTGSSLLECQACNNVTNISGSFIYYLTIGNSICDVSCPTGQYIRVGFPNYCQSCSVQCIGCSVTSTNCTESFLCTVGYFFYVPTNSCLTACPSGFYANSTTKYCVACPGGCALCTAGNLNSCSKCQVDPSTGISYFKEIYMSSCVTTCIDGQYSVPSDNSCQPCNPSCVLCSQTSTNCTKCKNVSGTLYFYHAQECLVTCPNGLYGEATNNTCVACNSACLLCYGPSTVQCYSCKFDSVASVNYYLSYGTTYCVQTCPYGQYSVNSSNTCQPCNINCATCVGTSTFCLTCTYVNTINIVYLYNATCILVCPNGFWMNSTAPLDHQCSFCHPFCAVCTGPLSTSCSSCRNQTVDSSLVIYYKDLYSTTCSETCPDGQFISAVVPNVCVPCSSACLRCAINSTNCFQCGFSFFLFVPTNSCLAQCPLNYFNNLTLTSNYYYCSQCIEGCLNCTGPGLNNCFSCQNSTNGSVAYFKNPTQSICGTSCSTGFYGNVTKNTCDSCQTGCLNCSNTASNCFACYSVGGNDYFKTVATNSCVTVCPSGYYGNSSDYTCRDCIYYTLNGSCIFTCPSGTFASAAGNKSICQDCNAANVTGNPCNRSYTFKVQTTVGNNGNSLVHKVILAGGLSSSITADAIRTNLSVNVVQPARRRLLIHGRLLAVTTPLLVSDVSISSDRTVIFITTNFQTFDFSTASVVVNFPAGTLVSSDGLMYQSTTASFPLSSPIFMQSYYNVFSKNITLGAQGMIFVILSVLLLVMQLVIANRKGYHEALSFIMTLQVLGVTRARQYPINFDIFSVILGYSYYELPFIPNGFTQLFPVSYVENSLEPLTFAFGGQNFITNLGSIIEVFLGLQIALAVYYVLKNDRPIHLARMKLLQETLICLFMVLNIYFSSIAMMSLSMNSLVGMSLSFLASIILALTVLICYIVYFLFWVRPFRLFELYKFNNLFRVIGLVILASNRYGGIILIDLSELIFMIIDLALYRTEKLNVKTYVAERLLVLISFNASVFSQSSTILLALMGSTMAIVFAIKLYYTAKTTKEFIDEMKIQEASEIDVSDIVNLSIKERQDPKQIKISAKESIDEKMNMSDNFIFNEGMEISRLEEQPTKHELLGLDQQDSEDREEEEKKNADMNEQSSSSQSNGELIVYLDPDDYKEEFLRNREARMRREQPKPQPKQEEPKPKKEESARPFTQMKASRRNLKVDGMRTGANFYPRARGPQNHQIIEEDVEVIKVQPNNSQVDNSDIISDTTEGFGWLGQNDERNISRARQNKTVWKIMDEQQVPKK